MNLDVLMNIGWAVEDRGFSEHREAGEHFEAIAAILSVAAVLLGPGSTAFALVESTLKSMKAMSDGPWMTFFRRESQSARAARFQVSVSEPSFGPGLKLALMACELYSENLLTQVLFFKFRAADVKLRHASGAVKIDDTR